MAIGRNYELLIRCLVSGDTLWSRSDDIDALIAQAEDIMGHPGRQGSDRPDHV